MKIFLFLFIQIRFVLRKNSQIYLQNIIFFTMDVPYRSYIIKIYW